MSARQKQADIRQRVGYLPDIHRLLPQAPDAENGVLSSFLLAPKEIGQLCAERKITMESFHLPANAMIFGLLTELHSENEPIDFITLTQILRDRGQLDMCGGAARITEIFTFLPTAANAGYYIEILEEKHTLREIIKTCTEYAARSYDEQDDVPALLAGAQDALLKIVRMSEGRCQHTRTMRELVMRASDRLQAALEGDGIVDMPTGITDLDHHMQGFRAPEVTIAAAKPSDGKTALCLNITEHLAIQCGKRVGIISLEMSDDQLADRLLASHARVNIREIKRKREISTDEINKIAAAAKRIAEAPIFIRDDGQLSMPEIGATLSAWKAQHGLDIAFIDHAQLIRGDGKTNGRTEEVEQVSRALKPLAKRLEIPIVILSQVSEDKDGQYSTKNSRALSEDCDNLLSISHSKEGSWIRISKQRDGERNVSVPVTFTPHLMRFSGKTRDQEQQPDLLDDPRKRKEFR